LLDLILHLQDRIHHGNLSRGSPLLVSGKIVLDKLQLLFKDVVLFKQTIAVGYVLLDGPLARYANRRSHVLKLLQVKHVEGRGLGDLNLDLLRIDNFAVQFWSFVCCHYSLLGLCLITHLFDVVRVIEGRLRDRTSLVALLASMSNELALGLVPIQMPDVGVGHHLRLLLHVTHVLTQVFVTGRMQWHHFMCLFALFGTH